MSSSALEERLSKWSPLTPTISWCSIRTSASFACDTWSGHRSLALLPATGVPPTALVQKLRKPSDRHDAHVRMIGGKNLQVMRIVGEDQPAAESNRCGDDKGVD